MRLVDGWHFILVKKALCFSIVFFTSQIIYAQVRLELVGYKWDEYGNYLAQFELENKTDKPIIYSGYSVSFPIYTVEFRKDDEWEEEVGGWCGVGMESRKLPKGNKVVFTLLPNIENGVEWRLKISYNIESGVDEKRILAVYSDSIVTTEKDENLLSSRSAYNLVKLGMEFHDGEKYPCRFTVKNISDKTLYYIGYDETDMPPFYIVQEWMKSHWAGDHAVDWSGSNRGFKALSPQQSLSFSIPGRGFNPKWRIGIRFFTSDAPVERSDAYRPVWWSAVTKPMQHKRN